MPREQEYATIASCPFETTPEGGVRLTDSTVQIAPMRFQRQYAKWTNDHFHEQLHVAPTEVTVEVDPAKESVEASAETVEAVTDDAPSTDTKETETTEKTAETTTTTTKTTPFVLKFQAMARESIAVLLSPKSGYARQAYSVFLGHQGNMQTVLQKSKQVIKRPNRVCQVDTWTSYWIVCLHEKLLVGVGDVPGEQLLAILVDDSNKQAIQYIGLGNASQSDRQAPIPLKMRNISLEPLSDELSATIASLTEEHVQVVVLSATDPATNALWKDYQVQCQKAKERAVKFGVPYTEPPPPSVSMNWSEARKLKANPHQGFITGMDLEDPEERAKQEKRRQRFGIPAPKEDEAETSTPKEELPIAQAWDNEGLVRKMRSDPPGALWKNPPPATTEEPKNDDFMETTDEPSYVEDKVHIFGIDWAAFKQIRTNDIMKHFGIYGPTYVEWLGDLSCNVCFQDQFSASRALSTMSTELPTPPPEEVPTTESEVLPDLGNMGWRMGKTMLRKIANDRYGRRGTTTRLLFRKATNMDVLKERPTKWPKPPPGFSTKRVLGPGSDQRAPKQKRQREQRNLFSSDPADMMSKGLSSSRDGFSVEELEAERALKRARKAPEQEAAAPES